MSERAKVLVVEDERLLRLTLRERLQREGFVVREAETGAAALEAIRDEEPDLILLDYRLPDMTGIEVLRAARELQRDVTAIFLTAYSSIGGAVEAMKLGAHDYLNKPVDHDELMATITKALETTHLRREVRRHRDEQDRLYGITNIVGGSSAIQDVLVMIRKIADSAASTVLIRGESGTGKDVVAKAIHFTSNRADKPFMNVTCTAIPETLLESELFGHERGSFTDAKQLKKGLFESAAGGTVFLDEIGDMGLGLQSKVLRFLDDKTFRRVGGSQDIRVDVRVIGATNRDLEKSIKNGSFREDLYYRLKVIPIYLPSLKERREDIPDLVNHFLDRFNREFKKSTKRVTAAAMECLLRYHWPGNIRELKNVIERVMILESRDEIDVADLPKEIVQASDLDDGSEEAAPEGLARATAASPLAVLPEEGISLRDLQRELVRQALERAGGNQSRAARLLGISRDALRYKVKSYGLA